MRSFTIEPFKEGKAAILYTVQVDGRPSNELEDFIAREDATVCSQEERSQCKICHGQCRRYEHLNLLADNLLLSINEAGFKPNFFARLDRYTYPIGAISAGAYRLFGIRYGSVETASGPTLFVACNGGIKLAQTIQEVPELLKRFNEAEHVARHLDRRLRQHGLSHPPLDAQNRYHLPEDFRRFDIF